ncbi:hypothetical protein RB195_022451 [Necator americanus]|uniref:Uncharacterized protein n=1 Tax=Necator americanus TaxID=51031 RepID=A0ABR1EFC3_NECAM
MEFVTHAYLHVNARPKLMVILTKSMDAADLSECIKKAFESCDIPLEKTLFRLYCKNAVPNLKSLIRSILTASSSPPGFRVEYFDVLGEIFHKGTRIRMKTSDIRTFCKLEELGRSLGMRFLTTFNCWSTIKTHYFMEVRYYDEVKSNGQNDMKHECSHTSRAGATRFLKASPLKEDAACA